MKERWKEVLNYEHAYLISNYGRIKSKERRSKLYSSDLSRQHSITEKIRKPSYKNGYLFCWLYAKDGSRKMQYLHRIVAQNFIPNPKNLRYIDHIDGDRTNNHVCNLRWCTQSKNMLNKKVLQGYFYSQKNKRYYSRLKYNGYVYRIGSFNTAEEAREAYKKFLETFMFTAV